MTRGPFSCVPSMGTGLEVKVLWGVDRNDPSKPQSGERELVAERSGERDLRGDEQKPDMRRGRQGRAGKKPQSSRDQESGCVNPALVQGQSVFLPGEISPYT